MEQRTAFYNTVANFWPDLYGEPYALYDLAFIQKKEAAALRQASQCAGHLFFKIASLLRRLDEETLLAMHYPKETIRFIRQVSPLPESIISRLDFAGTNGEYKVMELNADTPTFIKELFSVNSQVCQHFGALNVNEGEEEQLQRAVTAAIEKAMQGNKEAYVVFTAHEDNEEDRLTVQYLQSLYQKSSRFVPLHQLHIIEHDGLYDELGQRIDILYRQTFPIESLLLDRNKAGEPIGEMLLSLVCEEKLAIINPPSAFLLQNKAVQAVIWGLHEDRHPFFTEEEHTWISAYFLPTYLEPDVFLEKQQPYVKKPVFGREGDTVEIYDGAGTRLLEDSQRSYEEYGFIYQEYVNLPLITTHINGKKNTVHLMYGSFLLSGKASSIGCRVGGKITNNLSYYLPLAEQQDEG